MNSLELFNFKGQEVRILQGVDGEPQWVATDVAKILGYQHTPSMTRRLDEDEKGCAEVHTHGGLQKVTTVTEAGLYQCIFGGKSKDVKAFKRWVTHDVLPTIRKRGMYATPETAEKILGDPDFLIETLQALKAERAQKAKLEAEAKANAPKVLFADAVATSNTEVLVGDLAKILKGNGVEIGATRLFKWLRHHGYLVKGNRSDWNMPTQRSMELGLFRVKETAVTHSDGHVTVSKTPKVTGKGQQYFVDGFLSGRFRVGER